MEQIGGCDNTLSSREIQGGGLGEFRFKSDEIVKLQQLPALRTFHSTQKIEGFSIEHALLILNSRA
jgi:hypothetical protein